MVLGFWKRIQEERARRDYNIAKESESPSRIEKLHEYALDNRVSLSSTLLEPGYCEEILNLLSEDDRDLTELRDQYVERKASTPESYE